MLSIENFTVVMWAGHLSVKTWRLIFTHLFVSSSCRGTVWTSPALFQTDWHSASDSTSLLLLLLNSAIVKLHWLVGNFLSFFCRYDGNTYRNSVFTQNSVRSCCQTFVWRDFQKTQLTFFFPVKGVFFTTQRNAPGQCPNPDRSIRR